ncbi:MAG: hypothetical protein GY834_10300 [Bacteroidetes bacterium]|nr:hypothetical protein [Bacteroidota bacterium]
MESVNYVSPEVIVPLVLPVVILGVLLWRGIKVLEYKKLLIAFVIVYYGIAAALLYFGDHGMSSTLKNRLGDIVFAIVIAVFMIFQPRGLYYLWLKFKANYRLFPYSD